MWVDRPSKVSSRPGSQVVITHSRDQRTPAWRLWPLNLAPISGPDASPTHSTRSTVGLHSAIRVALATNDQTASGAAAICFDTSSRLTAVILACSSTTNPAMSPLPPRWGCEPRERLCQGQARSRVGSGRCGFVEVAVSRRGKR